MAQRLLLGQLDLHRVQSSHERSLRLLVKGMDKIHVEVTPELIRGLAVVIEHWPDARSEPHED
jgi:hypothetical protein